MATSKLLVLLGLCALTSATQLRFDDFKVYRVVIETSVQSFALKALEKTISEPFNYWKGVNAAGGTADIMVAPRDQEPFEALLEEYEFKWQLMVKDVQQLISQEQPENRRFGGRADGTMNWESYHTFDEIMAWMDQLLIQYPDVLTDVHIGYSYEGRPIRGMIVSKKTNHHMIVIEATTHANEWIAAATATHFLNELLNPKDTGFTYIASSFDWLVIPIHNPDGYVYTWEHNRMWRKTRSRSGLICFGADPNRNWGYKWVTGVDGASDNVCETYHSGKHAYSEPEADALSKYLRTIKDKIGMYLSFHSYSQLVLYPYSHTTDPAPDEYMLRMIAEVGAFSMRKAHGVDYQAKSFGNMYAFTAPGTSTDFAYGELGVIPSFTLEFRDTGFHGMLLPAEQIIPNAEEIEAGVVAMVQEAIMYFLLKIVE